MDPTGKVSIYPYTDPSIDSFRLEFVGFASIVFEGGQRWFFGGSSHDL